MIEELSSYSSPLSYSYHTHYYNFHHTLLIIIIIIVIIFIRKAYDLSGELTNERKLKGIR